MKVGLDVTPTIVGVTGVSRYTAEVWRGLLGRDDVEVSAFAAGRGRAPPLPARRTRVPLRVMHAAWKWTGRPKAEALVGDIDIVHSFDLIPPPSGRPVVMNVHDVTSITHPDMASPSAARLQREQLRAARDAAIVLALSEAAAAEIGRVGGIPRSRIVVASVGVRPPACTLPSSVSEPYILAVGEVSLRKGFDVLARAVAVLPGAPRLYIAGPDGWGADEVKRRIASVGHESGVVLLGRVDDRLLEGLYQNATLVCHTSYAEGFGLPCLEAMACGAAVVATDIPPVREMAEGCVAFVEPGDVEGLSATIESLLRDPDKRSEMGRLARERASAFRWDAVVDRVVGAYRRALT